MGNPFEWLRSMARGRGDGDQIAAETARALASLAGEPAGLVVACRRLLCHHPHDGQLWWVMANVLTAADPAATMRRCADQLEADRTSSRLAGLLPLQDHGQHLAVSGWSPAIRDALEERPDIDVVAVVDDDNVGAYRQAARRAELVDPWQLSAHDTTLVLVPAHAFDSSRAVVDTIFMDVVEEIPRGVDVWLVGGVGRVLPPRLLEALEAAAADDEQTCTVALERFDRVVGPGGLETTIEAASRCDCPIAPELLRTLD